MRSATRVDCGVSIGIFPTIERAARAGRRLPRRGLQANQAEDRAWLRLRAGARGARALARDRAAGRRQHGLLTGRRACRGAEVARRVRSVCSSSSRCPRTTWPATRCSRSRSRTPICLDESIVSAESAADAIARGACSIVNIKAGRVGGYLEAVRVHDVCRAARCAGVVRRDARDRPRTRGQRRARRAARLHVAGRHVGLRPLLRARHHRALRARGRSATGAERPGPRCVATGRGARDRRRARSRSFVTRAAAAHSCPGRPRPRSSILLPSARRQRHASRSRGVCAAGSVARSATMSSGVATTSSSAVVGIGPGPSSPAVAHSTTRRSVSSSPLIASRTGP